MEWSQALIFKVDKEPNLFNIFRQSLTLHLSNLELNSVTYRLLFPISPSYVPNPYFFS